MKKKKMSNQSYIYIIKPRKMSDVGDMPAFIVIAKNSKECWNYVYKKYGSDTNTKEFLSRNMCIGGKLSLKYNLKSKLLYASMC